MKNDRKIHRSPFCLGLLLLCVAGSGAAVQAAAGASSFEKEAGPGRKTLTRCVDPVIIQGEVLGREVRGLPLDGFRLFAARQGVLSPVPYQIDEVDAEGLFVLPDGMNPSRDEPDLHGILDSNDELVFMAGDLGDRVSAQQWPPGVRAGVQIEVLDPLTGGRGWCSLLWFEDPPAPGPVEYVRYGRQEDRIYAETYSLGYSPDRDLVYTMHLSLLPGAGPFPSPDIMDRINIRFTASIFLRSITFSRNEDDFVSEVVAYKDGPVRVMRRVANSMRLVLGLRTPRIIAYSVYYRDAIETPNVMTLPVSLDTVAHSAYFEGGTDHNRNAMGMRFYSSNNLQGVLVDGRMSPEELAMDHGDYDWTLLTGTQGQVISLVEMGEKARQILSKRLIYVDDMFFCNAPEDEPGTTPKVGFSLENILGLKRGTYTYNARFYFPRDPGLGAVQPYIDILENPLQVRVVP